MTGEHQGHKLSGAGFPMRHELVITSYSIHYTKLYDMLEAKMQELSHPMNDYRIRSQRFLEAWKRGIALIGPRFFEVDA